MPESRTFACRPQVQMSGSSKVEMSAFRAQWPDARTAHVEHEGTGSPAGHDPDRRAAADAAAGGGAAAAERAPGPAPVSAFVAGRRRGSRVAPARAPERRAASRPRRGTRALALIRERYADFGPTFAHQKLTEEHALALSVETLRGWMIAAGLWVPRTQRARRSYPPRAAPRLSRRAHPDRRLGPRLVRGPRPALHAAGLRRRRHQPAHGALLRRRPSPRSTTSARRGGISSATASRWRSTATGCSVFHVQARDRAQGGPGLSQFGRALRDLNIDSLCAPTARRRKAASSGPTARCRIGSSRSSASAASPTPAAAEPFLPGLHGRLQSPLRPAPARRARRASRRSTPTTTSPQIFTLQETRRITPRAHRALQARTSTCSRTRVANRRLAGRDGAPQRSRGWHRSPFAANGRVLASRLFPKDQAHLVPGGRRRAQASRRRLRLDRGAAARARRRPPRQPQDHAPGQAADPRRSRPVVPHPTPRYHVANADISTLGKGGHFHFVLTLPVTRLPIRKGGLSRNQDRDAKARSARR